MEKSNDWIFSELKNEWNEKILTSKFDGILDFDILMNSWTSLDHWSINIHQSDQIVILIGDPFLLLVTVWNGINVGGFVCLELLAHRHFSIHFFLSICKERNLVEFTVVKFVKKHENQKICGKNSRKIISKFPKANLLTRSLLFERHLWYDNCNTWHSYLYTFFLESNSSPKVVGVGAKMHAKCIKISVLVKESKMARRPDQVIVNLFLGFRYLH